MAWFALLLVSALWGIHPVVGKAVEAQMAPLPLTVWRFTLCAVCYIPLYKRLSILRHLSWQRLVLLIISALCWAVFYPLLYYQSLRYLSPVESLLIVNTSPLIAALLAWGLLRERLHLFEWLGVLVSFAGILILVIGQPGGHGWVLGVVVAAVAAIAFSGYTVSSRFLFQRMQLSEVLILTSLFGAVGLWIYTLFSGQTAVVATALTYLSASGWWELGYIVVAVSTIAYVLYGYGLQRLPAGISSALTFYPQVVFTAIAAWLWWHQAPTWLTLVSACFILGGTGIMRIRRPKGDESVAEETVSYFAYGSCMNPQDFSRTVPDFHIEGPAVLEGHRLAFTRYSEGRQGGVADIVPNEAAQVEGVLYRFPAEHLPALDMREGVPDGFYQRVSVTVRLGNRDETAWTYMVIDKEQEEIAPGDGYRDIILAGAKLLSQHYQENISRHMISLQTAASGVSAERSELS